MLNEVRQFIHKNFIIFFHWFSSPSLFYLINHYWLHFKFRYLLYHSFIIHLFLDPKSHVWLLTHHDNTIRLDSKYIFPMLYSKVLQKPQIFE